MTAKDTRTFTLDFDNGNEEVGRNWHFITDDNNFFAAEINSMDRMSVGDSVDCDFVVVTRTA